MNKITLIGNLTHDPEVRSTPNGVTVCSFTIAVNRRFASGSGGERPTDFFRIKSFGGLAENAGKYLGKGSKVFVQGRIEPTKYEKDGKTEYGFDFIAEEIEYLDTKAPGGGQ